ncbi:MAG: dNTP triphosphohydrolase [Bacteroidota bacterium]|nr:dNTP triphosphohydrolase [Bacteroidota bacterium]
MALNWVKLLNSNRLGFDQTNNAQSSSRSSWQIDYDRIVFSSAFRKLQGKTQVIPIPESEFVHTRLTHSIEVSSVGRSLGAAVGEKLLANKHQDKYGLNEVEHFAAQDMGTIVATACLAHDLGNPPFGHSGESCIGAFFCKFLENNKDIDLTIAQTKDLCNYEGNAAGFRILTNQSQSNTGLMLSYSSLAAFSKYPCASTLAQGKNAAWSGQKKFGYFIADHRAFTIVAEATGLQNHSPNGQIAWHRHPLSFLMEAADDICYRIVDLEDGCRINFINFNTYESLLLPIVEYCFQGNHRYLSMSTDDEKIIYLRAKAINGLTSAVAEVFMANYDKIMSCEYRTTLLDGLNAKLMGLITAINNVSLNYLYKAKPVVALELVGYEVITGLLELFITAVSEVKISIRSKQLLSIVPANFKRVAYADNKYESMLDIAGFIASMTDREAINLYRQLKGIELPRV